MQQPLAYIGNNSKNGNLRAISVVNVDDVVLFSRNASDLNIVSRLSDKLVLEVLGKIKLKNVRPVKLMLAFSFN